MVFWRVLFRITLYYIVISVSSPAPAASGVFYFTSALAGAAALLKEIEMLYLNNVQMKKDKFRKNGVLAFLGHMPLFPEKRCPRLKPGDVRNIEITRLSKSKRSGFFVVAGGK
jgi:hypothetical protein